MTPQRLLEIADHIYQWCGCPSHEFGGCDATIAELRAHADQLERNGELLKLVRLITDSPTGDEPTTGGVYLPYETVIAFRRAMKALEEPPEAK